MGATTPQAWLSVVSVVMLVSSLAIFAQKTNTPQAAHRFAHVLDLTHALDEDTPYIPIPNITFPFKKTPIATVAKNGVAAYRWEIHEHLGTQIDAPSHFFEQGISLDRLAVDSLVVPLVVIDISARATSNSDTSVTTADVEAWERQHGRIPEHAAVMMASGWDSRIKDAKAFVNADASGAMHFPGFSPEAASFLARSRQMSGIGVDTLSLDPGLDVSYAAHKAWLATGKWGVELVANLRQVPAVGATVFVGATKVRGATGGPVRLIAVW
jgi:kynurenine formamidase